MNLKDYFIYPSLEVKNSLRGLGVFAKTDLSSEEIIEHSPFSSCWSSNWENTPYALKKIVFTFPEGNDNYVVALGYISIYNHSDDNNATWHTSEKGFYIKTKREEKSGEEIFIHYGEAYWSGGWPKF